MKSIYRAYLLRLHRELNQTDWRATLENANTGEFIRFANEREMIHYLMKVLIVEPSDPNAKTESEGYQP
jgi:hypothetical protein